MSPRPGKIRLDRALAVPGPPHHRSGTLKVTSVVDPEAYRAALRDATKKREDAKVSFQHRRQSFSNRRQAPKEPEDLDATYDEIARQVALV